MYRSLENKPQPTERDLELERLRDEWARRVRARYKESCELRGEDYNLRFAYRTRDISPTERVVQDARKKEITRRICELIDEDNADLERAKREGYDKNPWDGELYGFGG